MKKICLNGKYDMIDTADGSVICKADIPGSDFGNMIKNGLIENPLNMTKPEELVKSVYSKNIAFETKFSLDGDDIAKKHIRIFVDKIDTLCSCFVNSKPAFKSNNEHISIEKDIKALVKNGENTIRFEIADPVKYIEDMQKKHALPPNNNGINGAPYLRKSACHFGWDWGPCVPYKYLGNVEIQCFDKKIENIAVSQKIEGDTAFVSVFADGADKIAIFAPNGDEIKGDDGEFEIQNPELWYTRDLNEKNEQPLYTVELSNDEETVTKKIGLRTVELNREKDEYGENFQLVVNGKRIFAKGANLIPFAAIPDLADEKTVDYYIDLAVKSNFNIIRVWGGATYANEYLMTKCDEKGILIWQDFCYACLLYPFYDEEFLQNVLYEAEQNVKRQQLHPSLGLYCGNNEIEAMFSYLPRNSKIIKAYIEFFYHQLPEHIKDYLTVPYIPSSPLGDKPFSQNTADGVGDTHMWNVWHGLKPLNYYEKRYTRFLSEFGLESLPSMKAIKTFATESEFDLASDAFMSHQKCEGGNEKMMFYLKERFDAPIHFEDLPYLTGIVQADCIESATLHFRRNKGRCNGSVFWQFNDVWNCPSWSGVDFEGVPKALMYKAKEFFAPVTVAYSNNDFYAINDTLNDKTVDFKITDTEGDIYEFKFNLKSDSINKIYSKQIKENTAVKVCWEGDERIFDNFKTLEKANIAVCAEGNKVRLKSDVFARNVFIDCDAYADKNYFSMMPGEEVIVTFDKDVDSFSVKCENNIEFEKSGIKKKFSQFFYRLKPLNIANTFYYEHN